MSIFSPFVFYSIHPITLAVQFEGHSLLRFRLDENKEPTSACVQSGGVVGTVGLIITRFTHHKSSLGKLPGNIEFLKNFSGLF